MPSPARTGLIRLLLATLAVAGCVAGFHGRALRGPFQGQVVDMESGQPIEGAVALAVWWEVVPTPVQGNTRFYDSREAVAGPDGRFEIASGLSFWSLGVQRPAFYVFAPGYQVHADIVTPPDGRPLIDPTIVQMRRLRTREERIFNLDRYPPPRVPSSKVPRLLEAVSSERAALGLKP